VTDPLTGLSNRRGLERFGQRTWADQAAHRQLIATLIVDIDHFKNVNDTLGHTAGDDVIRRVAELLTAPDLSDDLPARLWQAIDVADHALYEAKRSGRNRVVAADQRTVDLYAAAQSAAGHPLGQAPAGP
jgi:PleD family two-component response regulator